MDTKQTGNWGGGCSQGAAPETFRKRGIETGRRTEADISRKTEDGTSKKVLVTT